MADRISSDPSRSGDWASYYDKTGTRPPRETLVRALDLFDREAPVPERLAVDLGSGSGRDTIEILRRGWPAVAVDAAPEAIEKLLARPDLPAGASIDPQICRYEDMTLPRCSLVNAGFSLPLCPRDAFPGVWAKVLAGLSPGGRFSGQFYGERDSWAGNPDMTHLSRPEAEAFLEPFDIEFFREEEDDSVTPRGAQKHWHIFHVVARKR